MRALLHLAAGFAAAGGASAWGLVLSALALALLLWSLGQGYRAGLLPGAKVFSV